MANKFQIIFLIMVVLLKVIPYLIEKDNKRVGKKDEEPENVNVPEKKLVEANKPIFEADTSEADTFPAAETGIAGDYRDHTLTLNTYSENKRTFTRLTVRPKKTTAQKRTQQSQETLDNLASQTVSDILTPNGILHLSGQLETTTYGREISYTAGGTLKDTKQLQPIAETLSDISAGYPLLLALGGEVVPALQEIATDPHQLLRPIVSQLLNDIAQTTTRQLGSRASRLLCPHCLVRYGPHKASFLWQQAITYYGCRHCGQSRNFLDVALVVATLADQAQSETSQEGAVLRVNWLTRRQVFDFNLVEIIQASDEDVERFVMQVGNDTDQNRQRYYRKWRCLISPQCPLSENTWRILRRTFGYVAVGTIEATVASTLI